MPSLALPPGPARCYYLPSCLCIVAVILLLHVTCMRSSTCCGLWVAPRKKGVHLWSYLMNRKSLRSGVLAPFWRRSLPLLQNCTGTHILTSTATLKAIL